MCIDPTRRSTGRDQRVEGDATILACDDESTDPPAAIDRPSAPDRRFEAPEQLTVSLAAWETDGGRVCEPPPAVPAGTAHG